MRQPRRIFRPAVTPPRLRGGALLLASVGLATAAGAILIASGLTTNLFSRAATPHARVTAEARDVAVIDGGTLRLGATVVRLAGIEPPARGPSCRMPDGGVIDCGAAAANALAALVRDRPVLCVLRAGDGRAAIPASCEAAGAGLGWAMVAAGWARARGDDAALQQAEAAAREAGRGLWADRVPR